jgi:hypothetical protein
MYIHVRDVTMRTKDVIPTIKIKEGDAHIHTSSIMYIPMLHVYARVVHVKKKISIDDAYHSRCWEM